jgi:hypothetical protein
MAFGVLGKRLALDSFSYFLGGFSEVTGFAPGVDHRYGSAPRSLAFRFDAAQDGRPEAQGLQENLRGLEL